MAAKNTRKVFDMVLCAIFVALITVGTFMRVPIPHLPFTLQLLFTTLAGVITGGAWGFTAVAIYIILGLMGFPVFTEGGGFGYVFKPSFGYIIGFAVASYVTGVIANKQKEPSYRRLLAATFSGLFIVYAFGMVYFYFMSNLYLGKPIGLGALFFYCFLIPIPGDVILCLLSSVIGKRLIPLMNAIRKRKFGN